MNVTIQLTDEQIARLEDRVTERLALSPEFVEAVAQHVERPLRWLDIRQVAERTRKGISTVRRDMKSGAFPAPIAYEGGKALWREADVEAFMKAREAEAARQQEAAA